MITRLSLVGVSHHRAPVALREQFALDGERAEQFLRAVAAQQVFDECVVLDTCNRTEVYLVGHKNAQALPYALGLIATVRGASPSAAPRQAGAYLHRGLEAVEHLFRVSASLDSQIVGEQQILGQVKDAYRLACREKSTGVLLNRLFHEAFRVGKRVQSQTNLGRGASSVPQAAVELGRSVLQSLQGRKVLLVGAGQTAQLAAQALLRNGVGEIIVANRTLQRAQEVVRWLLDVAQFADCDQEPPHVTCPALNAAASGAAAAHPAPKLGAITLDDLPRAIGSVDLVISSTGSPSAVLTHELVAPALDRSRKLLIIDIAVPRDVDQRLGELPHVRLHNIDDLQAMVDANLQRRRDEIPKAQAIVDGAVKRFGLWLDSLDAAGTIRLLRRFAHNLQQDQLDRHCRKLAGNAQAREAMTALAHSLTNKLLHKPMTFVRGKSNGNGADRLAALDLLRRIFDLDEPEARP